MQLPEIPRTWTIVLLLLLIAAGILVEQAKGEPVPEFLIIAFTSVVSYLLGASNPATPRGGINGNAQ